tara:strand:+ start:50864 stop:52957 length:2094 start_codon:yes stop_codon:yes gene_type:complete
MTTEILWSPALPPAVIAALAGLAAALLLVQVLRAGMKGVLARAALLGALILALLVPSISVEERTAESDIALIVIDESTSQRIGVRRAEAEAAVAAVRESFAEMPGLDVRTVTLGDGDGSANKGGTRLVGALSDALGDMPRSRFAGAVVITDGQIHDADLAGAGGLPGPVHMLITGKRDEKDRRLVISDAPGYGIVGNDVSVRYRIEERAAGPGAGFGDNLADVTIRVDGEVLETLTLETGKEHTLDLTLAHAGATIVEIEAGAAPDELSSLNNRAVVSINGVRDRLRVLLVSGQPHAGERAWRNLLKSDPSVDLVHFTILRPPEKNDFTPLNEISLIAFPVRELFEEKIDEFDLIVFDRYMVRDVLPPSYFRNIAEYVRGGGAVMLSVGPEYAGLRSLARTPLVDILPASPTGRILESRFKPRISELGHRHPVTSGLPGGVVPGRDDLEPTWGAWFRQIGVTTSVAPTLMSGADGNPLLIMERVDEGRVALIASDHLWLWSRGFDGGGPQAELMRRVAHWLMKEPELDEEGLFARVDKGELRVERRSLTPGEAEVQVQTPSGDVSTVSLKPESAGRAIARIPADEIGLYRISNDTHTALAPAGALNPLELADLRASDVAAKKIADALGGSVHWLQDGLPQRRSVQADRRTHGAGWVGMVRNEAFSVTGVTNVPLAPWWLVLFLGVGLASLAWWREGR